MRRIPLLLALSFILCLPVVAQNTDIESLAGLQFNFGNPGARALGMGGAFLGLADDASAAEANPAGLTILRKPEITIEARHYLEQQILTTSGTYPDLERTGFGHNSQNVQVAFASAVYPIKNKFTIGGYYHEPLRNSGGGYVVRLYDPLTGQVQKDVPTFHFPRDNSGLISREECNRLRKEMNDIGACVEWGVVPFISALDVEQRTWGVAAAWQVRPSLSIGATVRYQTFKEGAFASRLEDLGGIYRISQVFVQATARRTESGGLELREESDLTFGVGFKWLATDKISLGGVYKIGPKFKAPIFASDATTNYLFETQADTTFHIPDSAGLGVSLRPIPALTINVDAIHVTYSNLVDGFYASNRTIREVGAPFEADDVTELHIGGEYFFSTKIPVAIRAGFWRDPAHSITYRGPLSVRDEQGIPVAAAESLLFPEGENTNHVAVGGGVAWPRVQIDFAYQTSKRYKVGSLTVVTRF